MGEVAAGLCARHVEATLGSWGRGTTAARPNHGGGGGTLFWRERNREEEEEGLFWNYKKFRGLTVNLKFPLI